MFKIEDYNKLHKIWDGSFSPDSSKLCASCGMCCHNTSKTLFPNEYNWLVKKTGQHNTEWKSFGCLCYSLKTNYKPVICKTFPLDFSFTLTGPIKLERVIQHSFYTNKCGELTLTDENFEKAQKFLDFLFSNPLNRAWYLMTIVASDKLDEDTKELEALGKHDLDEVTLYKRSVMSAFGISVPEFEEFWNFNK